MSSPNKTDKKAFFAGLHGVITGMAALATASVAIIGLSINQGWIGGTKTGGGTSVTTTAGAAAPQFVVDPTLLSFHLIGPPTASVDVSNVGTVPMTVRQPSLAGPGASHFSVADQTCGASVPTGHSCHLQVTFHDPGGAFNAVLVVQVIGAATATQVPITAGLLSRRASD